MKLLIAFIFTINMSLTYGQSRVLTHACDIFQTKTDPQRIIAYLKIYENGEFYFGENSKIVSYSPPLVGNWSFSNDTLYLEYNPRVPFDSQTSTQCLTTYRLVGHELLFISTSDHVCRVDVKSFPFHQHISATFTSEEQKILRND